MEDAGCDLHLPPRDGMDQIMPFSRPDSKGRIVPATRPDKSPEKARQILSLARLRRYCYHGVPLLLNVHSVTTPFFFLIAVSLIPSYNFPNAVLRAGVARGKM
jgi:hypothetical protein